MTGVPERDLPYASWKNDDAWMERMSGTRWNTLIKDENDRYQRAINVPAVQFNASQFHALMNSILAKSDNTYLFRMGPIQITRQSAFHSEWNFVGSKKTYSARDVIVSQEGYVWATRDVGNGSEEMALECYKDGKKVWSRGPVGPDLGLLGSNLFYLTVNHKLRYPDLMMCNARTGASPKKIQSVPNEEWNLALDRQPDHNLVLLADHSQEGTQQKIFQNGQLRQQPNRWMIPKTWILPKGEQGVAFCWPRANLLITKRQGDRTLQKCFTKGSPQAMMQIPAGDILFDPWASWEGKIPCRVIVSQPHRNNLSQIQSRGSALALTQPSLPTGLIGHSYHARSADGTLVRGFLVLPNLNQPTKLLVTGYGAQGIPSSTGSAELAWGPLLRKGWAIAQTFLRGGGDHTDAWGQAGRRAGRVRTFEDFETLIREAQKLLHITPRKTVIQGRSAGGFLVGGVLSRNPGGSLMQGVFTEVPYVDILRTTTNPELPLTKMEQNEFGDPTHRLEDFITNALLSPADAATVIRTPKVFVLDKTAVNDSQVFAQESVKWIRRLRDRSSAGAPKLCFVELKEGHFTTPGHQKMARILDCALLDAWAEGKLSSVTA